MHVEFRSLRIPTVETANGTLLERFPKLRLCAGRGPRRADSSAISFHECPLQRSADAAVLADPPEVDREQQRHRQRNRNAVQHVKAVQAYPRRRIARRAVTNRASEALVIISMPPTFNSFAPGPSCPRNGVARAMFEPTVMAQIANWSHGSR